MKYTIIMIGYFIIYFGGWAILARMWRKAKKESNKNSTQKNDTKGGEQNASNLL